MLQEWKISFIDYLKNKYIQWRLRWKLRGNVTYEYIKFIHIFTVWIPKCEKLKIQYALCGLIASSFLHSHSTFTRIYHLWGETFHFSLLLCIIFWDWDIQCCGIYRKTSGLYNYGWAGQTDERIWKKFSNEVFLLDARRWATFLLSHGLCVS